MMVKKPAYLHCGTVEKLNELVDGPVFGKWSAPVVMKIQFTMILQNIMMNPNAPEHILCGIHNFVFVACWVRPPILMVGTKPGRYYQHTCLCTTWNDRGQSSSTAATVGI